MINRRFLFLCFFLPLVASCGVKEYKTLDDGVIVNVRNVTDNGPQKVRLTVMSDRIVRVSATPDKSFHDRSSLIILPDAASKTQFVVRNHKNEVELQTTALSAIIDKADGKVRFTDAGGNSITKEAMPASFTPITVDDTHGYSTINRFETQDDEGLYGLGQHQSDQWNYKGQNEELYQYNTKISIPFVISSARYGLLWDSYSMGRFGNSEPYMQLNRLFKLYDKDGNPGSLTGTYYGGMRARGITIRQEDSIYFVDSETVKNLPRLGQRVLYEGSLEAPESGTYDFILYYAGYIRVFLGDEEVVKERWRTAWNPNSYKFSFDMEQGKRYDLRIEWRPDGTPSYCGLRAYAPVTAEEKSQICMWNEMVQQSDYYFIAGENMDGVIQGLQSIVGKANMLPKWAMGFWQSREHYQNQNEVVQTVREFRRRGIGLDNIVQDWNYWKEDEWGSHEFDETRYPAPQAMVDRVHEMNAHLMISVWPKFYASTEHYKEFDSHGWMYTRAVEDSIRDWVGPGYIGSFYDAYSAGARELFWNQLKDHLYGYGIDAWWMDASEPNIRDCVPMDYWKALCGPTALGSSTEYLMAYSLMNAQAIYEGLMKEDSSKRVFQLTRSGFAGLQRYSTASWSGDIGTRWEDMRSQITAGLNYSLCGNPYWTMDIGGFCVENRYANAQRYYDRTHIENEDLKEWRELQTRWYQFGTFAPLYRAHGQYPLREVWNIAPASHPAYKSIVYYNSMRYRLMPYIYSLAGRAWLNGSTIMRGLVMDYPDDIAVYDISDQYMFGPSLMICPVYEYGARSRSVYLPDDRMWFDYYTDSVYAGGQTIMADAPYERIPIFVPAGGIVFEGPEIKYVDQVPAREVTVDVYGGRNGRMIMYEDDGVSNDYQDGAYTVIPFFYSENSGGRTLTIGRRNGSYEGMIERRTFNIRLHVPGQGVVERKVDYSGDRIEMEFNIDELYNTITD
jgi:alpha-D-xyloside xylohydrolase